jgi:hypothetical protein
VTALATLPRFSVVPVNEDELRYVHALVEAGYAFYLATLPAHCDQCRSAMDAIGVKILLRAGAQFGEARGNAGFEALIDRLQRLRRA